MYKVSTTNEAINERKNERTKKVSHQTIGHVLLPITWIIQLPFFFSLSLNLVYDVRVMRFPKNVTIVHAFVVIIGDLMHCVDTHSLFVISTKMHRFDRCCKQFALPFDVPKTMRWIFDIVKLRYVCVCSLALSTKCSKRHTYTKRM